jgi:MbtH protein
MSDDRSSDAASYQVLVNDEEQYSLWPAGREIPKGWRSTGTSGPKEQCLEAIAKTWTDMRPLSLRRAMDGVR